MSNSTLKSPELTYTFNNLSAKILLWVLYPIFIFASLFAFDWLEPLERVGTVVIAAGWVVIIYGVYLHYPLRKRFIEPYNFTFKITRKDEENKLVYFNSYGFSERRNIAYSRILRSYSTGHYVYVIKDASASGYYKIGRTNNPASRLYRFGVMLPFEVHIIAIINCEDEILLEASLHRQFTNKRINGEWFNLDGIDISWIVEHYGLTI